MFIMENGLYFVILIIITCFTEKTINSEKNKPHQFNNFANSLKNIYFLSKDLRLAQ